MQTHSFTQAHQGLATAAQAAAFLYIHRATLWRYSRTGVITPVKFGGSVRYRWADLHAIAAGDGGQK